MVSDEEALWVRVIRSKYGLDDSLPDSIARDQSSFLWNSLSKVWVLLRKNLIWSVGNWNKIQCWKDLWIPNVSPLINYIPTYANINTNNLLSDLSTEEGNWNLNLLQVWLL